MRVESPFAWNYDVHSVYSCLLCFTDVLFLVKLLMLYVDDFAGCCLFWVVVCLEFYFVVWCKCTVAFPGFDFDRLPWDLDFAVELCCF